jgi:hypothetical protein
VAGLARVVSKVLAMRSCRSKTGNTICAKDSEIERGKLGITCTEVAGKTALILYFIFLDMLHYEIT